MSNKAFAFVANHRGTGFRLVGSALIVMSILITHALCLAQTIVTSQIGFAKSDPKSGVLTVPSGTPILATFQVIDLLNNIIGGDSSGNRPVGGKMTSWIGSDTTGDTYQLQFSDVTTAGTYRLRSNGVLSYPFVVRDSIYDVRAADGLKFFEIQDSTSMVTGAVDSQGYPIVQWTSLDGATGFHRSSHKDDARRGTKTDGGGGDTKLLEQPIPSGLPVHPTVTGGWYDAGDYNKYMGNAPWAVYNLMLAYEDSPLYWSTTYAGDRNYNGIPDILDHATIALNWMETMVWTDGSVFERVFNGYNAPFDSHPENETDGVIGDADDRPLDSDRYADITAKSSYAFATAARIGAFGATKQASYLNRAKQTWQWAYANQATVKPKVYGAGLYFGDITMGLTLGALELLKSGVTSVTVSNQTIDLLTYAVGQIQGHISSWNYPSTWDYQATYALERYYELPNANSSIQSSILTTLQQAYAGRITRQSTNPYFVNDEWLVSSGFGQNDLGVSSAFDALWLLARVSAQQQATYRNYALNEIQWVWGRNPFGESWLTSELATEYTRNMVWKATARHPIRGVVVPGAADANGNGLPDYQDNGLYYYAEPSINQQAMYVRTLAVMDRVTQGGVNPADYPPTVTILQPAAGQLITQNTTVTVSAQAGDDHTGLSVTWAVDGISQATMACSETSPLSCSGTWSVGLVPVGAHTIAVTAIDSSGQTQTATVTVQVVSSTTNPSTTLKIASIVVGLNEKGRGSTGQVQGMVSLSIRDMNGTPISGVSVTGHWEGSASDTFSVTDNNSTQWLDYSNAVPKSGTVLFTAVIDSVSKAGYVFDMANSVMKQSATKTY